MSWAIGVIVDEQLPVSLASRTGRFWLEMPGTDAPASKPRQQKQGLRRGRMAFIGRPYGLLKSPGLKPRLNWFNRYSSSIASLSARVITLRVATAVNRTPPNHHESNEPHRKNYVRVRRRCRRVGAGHADVPGRLRPRRSPPRAQPPAASAASKDDQTVVLDPFTVNVVSNGYATDQTMSGSRIAQSLIDVPISVGIINAEQLSDLHAMRSQDAVAYGAPGFSPNTRVSDDYNVRGFRTEFVLQDGVTITQTELKALYDIDRVEVIRGPIATTLGSNGSDFLGGVINFITRQPTATPQGFIDATFGNHSFLPLPGAECLRPAL